MAAKSDANASPDLVSGPMEITITDATNPGRRFVRDSAGAVVRTTGLTKLNRNGTILLDGLAKEKGFAPDGYKLKLGGNPDTGFVALYPVDANTTGSAAIARDRSGTHVTVYLHGLFEKVDGLRPTENRKCMAAPGTDTKGNACILIGLKSALEKRAKPAGTRKSTAAGN